MQESINAKLCVKQWFKSRFLPLENSRGIVSHAVCEAAGNQKYKSSRQGLSRQMLQAHVPAKIPHLPPDQIMCATGWKKIAGVGVWLHVGCLGGKKQKGAFRTEQYSGTFLDAPGEEGKNLPRNKLEFISKGHIPRWRENPRTETSPGLLWGEMVLSHDTSHQLNPVSSEKRSQAGFSSVPFQQGHPQALLSQGGS